MSYRSYGTVTPPSNVETCYDARYVNACLRFFRMLLKSSEKRSGASPSGSKVLVAGLLVLDGRDTFMSDFILF